MLCDYIRDICEGKTKVESLNVSEVYSHIGESWGLLKSLVGPLETGPDTPLGECVLCCAGFVLEDDVAIEPCVFFIGTKKLVHWDYRGHRVMSLDVVAEPTDDGATHGDIYIYADSDFVGLTLIDAPTLMIHPHILAAALPDPDATPPALFRPKALCEEFSQILMDKPRHGLGFLRFEVSSAKNEYPEMEEAMLRANALHSHCVAQEELRKRAEERRLSRTADGARVYRRIGDGDSQQYASGAESYASFYSEGGGGGGGDGSGTEDDLASIAGSLQGAPQQNSPMQSVNRSFPPGGVVPAAVQHLLLHRSVSEEVTLPEETCLRSTGVENMSFASNSAYATIGGGRVQSLAWEQRVDRLRHDLSEGKIPSLEGKANSLKFLHAATCIRPGGGGGGAVSDGCLLMLPQELLFVGVDSAILLRCRIAAVSDITFYSNTELARFGSLRDFEPFFVHLCSVTHGAVSEMVGKITGLKPVRVQEGNLQEAILQEPSIKLVVEGAEQTSVKERQRKVRFNRQAEVLTADNTTETEVAIQRRKQHAGIPPVAPPCRPISPSPHSDLMPFPQRQGSQDLTNMIDLESDEEDFEEEYEEYEEYEEDTELDGGTRTGSEAPSPERHPVRVRKLRAKRPSFEDPIVGDTTDDETGRRPYDMTWESSAESRSLIPAAPLASASPLIDRKRMKRRNSQDMKNSLQPLVRQNPNWAGDLVESPLGGSTSFNPEQPPQGLDHSAKGRRKSSTSEKLQSFVFPVPHKKLSGVSMTSTATGSSVSTSATVPSGVGGGGGGGTGETVVIRAATPSEGNSPIAPLSTDSRGGTNTASQNSSSLLQNTGVPSLVDSILEKEEFGLLYEPYDDDGSQDPDLRSFEHSVGILSCNISEFLQSLGGGPNPPDPALDAYIARLFSARSGGGDDGTTPPMSPHSLYGTTHAAFAAADGRYRGLLEGMNAGGGWSSPNTPIDEVFKPSTPGGKGLGDITAPPRLEVRSWESCIPLGGGGGDVGGGGVNTSTGMSPPGGLRDAAGSPIFGSPASPMSLGGQSSSSSSSPDESFDLPSAMMKIQEQEAFITSLQRQQDILSISHDESSSREAITTSYFETTLGLWATLLSDSAWSLRYAPNPPLPTTTTPAILGSPVLLHSPLSTPRSPRGGTPVAHCGVQTDASGVPPLSLGRLGGHVGDGVGGGAGGSVCSSASACTTPQSSPGRARGSPVYDASVFSPDQQRGLDKMIRRTSEVLQMGSDHADALLSLFITMKDSSFGSPLSPAHSESEARLSGAEPGRSGSPLGNTTPHHTRVWGASPPHPPTAAPPSPPLSISGGGVSAASVSASASASPSSASSSAASVSASSPSASPSSIPHPNPGMFLGEGSPPPVPSLPALMGRGGGGGVVAAEAEAGYSDTGDFPADRSPPSTGWAWQPHHRSPPAPPEYTPPGGGAASPPPVACRGVGVAGHPPTPAHPPTPPAGPTEEDDRSEGLSGGAVPSPQSSPGSAHSGGAPPLSPPMGGGIAAPQASPEAEVRLQQLQQQRQLLEMEVRLRRSQSPGGGGEGGGGGGGGGASAASPPRRSKKVDLERTLWALRQRRREIEKRLAANNIAIELPARELAKGFDASLPLHSSPGGRPGPE